MLTYRRFAAVRRQEAAEGALGTVGAAAALAVERLLIQLGRLGAFLLLLLTPHQGHHVQAGAQKLPVGALSRDLTLGDTDRSDARRGPAGPGWVLV